MWVCCICIFIIIVIYKLFNKKRECHKSDILIRSCIKECLNLLNLIGLEKLLGKKSEKMFTNLILIYHKELYKDEIFDDICFSLDRNKLKMKNLFGDILLKFIESIKFDQCGTRNLEILLDETEFPKYLLKNKLIYETFLTNKVLYDNVIKYYVEFPLFNYKKNFLYTFLNGRIVNIFNTQLQKEDLILPDTIIMILVNNVQLKDVSDYNPIRLTSYLYNFFCLGGVHNDKAFICFYDSIKKLEKNGILSFIVYKRNICD
ncbi:hypothetical protein TUBRATIS_29660 [Tubulinosema ratisbonensis]|uniref:Uncharacterized protein n=1 Tax=Tubulinosema ratisbonensis TaxID=291195 RepID=A0A437AHH7_9MICR|nr:hypothetical protein TUBRATIS_29660 [Tubulinosema ratisbonensis]